ncbi:tyrosine--tRNA ligase [Canibacter sp. lx-45]|uniref:tyrosine--tRNA ligase n=1 Tax=Canibacter zhuwentaonis TaxID=2837491 RepID=UPI001BDD846B|nr:tyrosine--tRNA ligase [Canibacter zhuwentaonis]MBT1035645.1 tyrosine--tRNA ligase [Canibacter zhuwentaonis]
MALSKSRADVLAAQKNDDTFEGLFDELTWRGFVSVSTDKEALAAALNGSEPITFYCGFDPTAPSLHLGHLVQVLFMRRLQLAGHKPLGLVGGSTGLIGDPRPTAERALNSRETVAEWVASLRSQIECFLSFDGDNAARMVNNLDWTADLSALDFLRDIGKFFRVGTMIKKDAVAARLASREGISYTEFSYQILQGYDFLQLFRSHGCTLQSGGQDQWGNIVGGIDLIRKAEGASVHAVGTPLITNSDGTKFGKSEGNAIWLDPQMCSPYAFYQFWLNQADADVVERLKIFTFLSRAEILEYEAQVMADPGARAAQKRLAFEVTALVHGEQAARDAIAAADALFGRGFFDSVPEELLRQATSDLVSVAGEESITVGQALVATSLVASLAEARRVVAQGGAAVNGVRVADVADLVADYARGRRIVVLGRGKKAKAVVVFD